jgi:hypothetical protein
LEERRLDRIHMYGLEELLHPSLDCRIYDHGQHNCESLDKLERKLSRAEENEAVVERR